MLEAFQPQGNTQLVAVTTAPSAALQMPGSIIGSRIRVDAACFFAFSVSSGVTCTIPTTSTPANGIPLMPGAETFNLAPNAWLSFATSSGTANAWFTGGFGV